MNPKDHPVFWILGLIAVCSGAVWQGWVYADDRWANKQEVNRQVNQVSADVQYFSDRQSKRYVEDQLFKLEQLPASKTTDAERAQLQKYRRDLRQLTEYWNQKGRPLQ